MKTFKILRSFTTRKLNLPHSTVIVAGKRTPIGPFNGKLSSIKATNLASIAINGALDSTGLPPEQIRETIDEVFLGNVCSAGLGQSPARQASLGAKVPIHVPCTTINKVCASGMKSVILGAQSIGLGVSDTVLAGGFESMSQVPFYLMNHRKGKSFGNDKLIDGVEYDGLTDAFNNVAMGMCGEKTAKDLGIDRAAQDEYAIRSYERAIKSIREGYWKDEITPVFLGEKEGTLAEDEEPKRFNKEKMLKLRTVFSQQGTITAANASKNSDGACALLLMSEEKAGRLGLKPLGRIISFGDAEVDPMDFCIAPTASAKICLERAGRKIDDVEHHEINEAFSGEVLANIKLLGLDPERVNVHGGAVAIGHPIGMSGARIILSLLNVMKRNNGKIGMASICNGGGGASSILIENLQ